MEINLLPKQTEAWDLFEDDITQELGYGGAAGGGKTRLGCYIAIYVASVFVGSRGGIGRRELKNLKRTTLASFFEVCAEQGLKTGDDFNYNQQDSIIRFKNGSEIILFDTAYQPSDPLYTRFGSYELTWCWVDESNESPWEAIQILKTRVGRRNRISGVEVKPFFLETFNPNKGHVYSRYYKPFKESSLPEYRRFIPALPGDNPHLPKSYIENLQRADTVTKERLLYGNFDYDDDPTKLIEYDKILNLWTNSFVESGEMFMSCDIAMQGSDKFVIMIWSGWRIVEIYSEDKSDPKHIEDIIKAKAEKYKIPQSNIVYDSDGLGNYLRGYLKNAKPFVNNSAPLNGENYQNLKAQCYFKLAEKINKDEIFINFTDQKIKETLNEELDMVKHHNADKDGKLAILPKEKIKEVLGRSPDYSDAMAYRMFFDLRPNFKIDYNLPSYFG